MLYTKYITLEDFSDYFQINLTEELGSTEKALGFLKRIEDRLEAFIDSNFARSISAEYLCFSDYQKKHYKLALLEQAIYVFKNGDISVDSGYDNSRGVVADIRTLKNISIAPNCKQELVLCGLWCRHINTNRGWHVW